MLVVFDPDLAMNTGQPGTLHFTRVPGGKPAGGRSYIFQTAEKCLAFVTVVTAETSLPAACADAAIESSILEFLNSKMDNVVKMDGTFCLPGGERSVKPHFVSHLLRCGEDVKHFLRCGEDVKRIKSVNSFHILDSFQLVGCGEQNNVGCAEFHPFLRTP